jgi:hypothetical protein
MPVIAEPVHGAASTLASGANMEKSTTTDDISKRPRVIVRACGKGVSKEELLSFILFLLQNKYRSHYGWRLSGLG